ncbi:MAG TPA: transcription antitermination factor NusB [Candidatus Hydrogenedentes bacterium]|nr:transcription antitermination factor NusB [Candidatus Hydrogenedentota bacterium]
MKFGARTLGRALAVQSLYGAACTGNDPLTVLDGVVRMGGLGLLRYHFDDEQVPREYAVISCTPSTRSNAMRYARKLLEGVSRHAPMIDPLIESHLIGWTRERVGRLEWAILQVAACEMLCLKLVDPPIAIDQAITLAKWFAQEETARFINGVLDAVARHAKTNKETDETTDHEPDA